MKKEIDSKKHVENEILLENDILQNKGEKNHIYLY